MVIQSYHRFELKGYDKINWKGHEKLKVNESRSDE